MADETVGAESAASPEPKPEHVAAAEHLWAAEKAVKALLAHAQDCGDQTALDLATAADTSLTTFHTAVASIMAGNGQVVPDSGGGGKAVATAVDPSA